MITLDEFKFAVERDILRVKPAQFVWAEVKDGQHVVVFTFKTMTWIYKVSASSVNNSGYGFLKLEAAHVTMGQMQELASGPLELDIWRMILGRMIGNELVVIR